MDGTGRPAPPVDCELCPRLVALRQSLRAAHGDWHNAPVASFGDPGARLVVVGLAPGMHGANRTGRPFTGDHAGTILYRTLIAYGFARGDYRAAPDDGLELVDCRITNAVRCLPPENRPVAAEINACRRFLAAELAPKPAVVVALGGIAHGSVVRALGLSLRTLPFRHGAVYRPADAPLLVPCYHCSRYNLNTGRLTPTMFTDLFRRVRALVDAG